MVLDLAYDSQVGGIRKIANKCNTFSSSAKKSNYKIRLDLMFAQKDLVPSTLMRLNPVPSFQVVSTSPPPLLSTSPPIHHHSTAGRVSQAVEKSEEDDLKMAAFPKDLDGQTCPGQLSKLLVHGQRFQLEIEQRMRSVGLPIISSNPDQT